MTAVTAVLTVVKWFNFDRLKCFPFVPFCLLLVFPKIISAEQP